MWREEKNYPTQMASCQVWMCSISLPALYITNSLLSATFFPRIYACTLLLIFFLSLIIYIYIYIPPFSFSLSVSFLLFCLIYHISASSWSFLSCIELLLVSFQVSFYVQSQPRCMVMLDSHFFSFDSYIHILHISWWLFLFICFGFFFLF